MSLPFNDISDNNLLETLHFPLDFETPNNLSYFDPRSSSDFLTDSIDPDDGLAIDFFFQIDKFHVIATIALIHKC